MLNKSCFAEMETRERREVVVWIILSLLVILVLAYFAFLAPKDQATIEVVVKPFQQEQDSIIWINLVRGRFLPPRFVSRSHRLSGIVASWDPSYIFVGLESGWYRYYVLELEFEGPSYPCASAVVDYMVYGRVDEVTDPKRCVIAYTKGEVFVEEGVNPPLEVDLNLPPGAPDRRG